jgi:hypothetical protein
MDKMFDYESLFTYSSLIFAFAIFIILLYQLIYGYYNNIENFTSAKLSSPVSAVVESIEVDDTGGITEVKLKSNSMGKYYNRTPPKVKFTKPNGPNGGSEATGIIKLKTRSIRGTEYLYDIDTITITQKGSGYRIEDKALVVIENITEYNLRANKENPLIQLDSKQKTTIKGLIEGCSSLNTESKIKYNKLIDIGAIRQYDVDDIINLLNNTPATDSTAASATPATTTAASDSTATTAASATPATTPATTATPATTPATTATPATTTATSAAPATTQATTATPATPATASAASATTTATSTTATAAPATTPAA